MFSRLEAQHYIQHREKVNNMTSQVDNKCPKLNLHHYFNFKRMLMQEETRRQIELENARLSSRILEAYVQSSSHGFIELVHKSKTKLLNNKINLRQQKLIKLINENQSVLKRIVSSKTHYDMKEWAAEYYKRKTALQKNTAKQKGIKFIDTLERLKWEQVDAQKRKLTREFLKTGAIPGYNHLRISKQEIDESTKKSLIDAEDVSKIYRRCKKDAKKIELASKKNCSKKAEKDHPIPSGNIIESLKDKKVKKSNKKEIQTLDLKKSNVANCKQKATIQKKSSSNKMERLTL